MSAVPSIAVPAGARSRSRPFVPQWPGWSRLPREARDTLFLLGVIAWTVLPHVSHLPPWAIALTTVILVWRGMLALTNEALPGRWLLVGVLVAALGLAYWSYGTLLGREPGVTLAVTLMALKTLELRARRDAFVVFFLGFFIILTHFLYSQSFLVALAMLVSVWGLLTALVLAHMPVGQPSLRQAGSLAARTAVLGAPIMALMFVLFPRIGPLWGVPQDGISRTGLSNTLRMGSVAEVASDDSVAMRLRFDGPVPPPSDLYFRGPVLTRFDGVEWRPLGLPFAPPGLPARRPSLQPSGPELRYEVTFEPLRLASVPLLEATTDVQATEGFGLSPREDLQWLAERPVFERIRLNAVAHTRFVLGAPRRMGELEESLELPAGFNPRTLAWARSLREQPGLRGAKATALAQAVLRHIRTDGYSYTLSPGEYGRDSVDEFWLDRKEGFCEHFAASFVVVMRALGVPARIVTGYQGADLLPVDGYTIVRQSSAHAWAEYWQADTGWVRADPTGAVAPDRIGRSSRLAPRLGFVAGALDTMNPELLARMRNAWEGVNNRWNQWILHYTRGQQLAALKNLGFETPTWEDLALLLVTALSGLALAGAAWAWLDRRRVDPWVRQGETLRQALQSLGIAAASHEGPRTLALRVRERLGAEGEPLAHLLDTLEAQRYGRSGAKRPDPRLTRDFTARARLVKTTAA
jgi:protein-glutamine gamma-glutamyltransferase